MFIALKCSRYCIFRGLYETYPPCKKKLRAYILSVFLIERQNSYITFVGGEYEEKKKKMKKNVANYCIAFGKR